MIISNIAKNYQAQQKNMLNESNGAILKKEQGVERDNFSKNLEYPLLSKSLMKKKENQSQAQTNMKYIRAGFLNLQKSEEATKTQMQGQLILMDLLE